MPSALPVLGHALELWFRPLEFVRRIRDCGDIAIIRIGTSDAYAVNHPALIRQLLVNDADKFDKGIQFDKMVPFTGNGLFNSHGEFHLRQRRLLQPAFHRARIAGYIQMMRELAEARIGSWAPGQRLAMNDELQALTLAIVTKALCSTDLGDQAIREFTRSLPVVLDGIGKRVLDPTGLLEKLPLPGNVRFDRALAAMHEVIDDIIRSYRDHGTDQGDLLSMMLLARDQQTAESMTDAQVHDEVMSLLAAGAETTADTLTWVCYLLGERPEVQQRVRAEVGRVTRGRPIDAADTGRLEYTRRVITETLRLYPTTWILTRRPRADAELGGHRIPAGAMVLFSLYALHRDPAHYTEPETFDPDRWLPERAGQLSRNAYLPFGAGVRGCIGEQFAWAESIVIVATLVRHWQFRLVAGERIRPLARALLVPARLSVIAEQRPGVSHDPVPR